MSSPSSDGSIEGDVLPPAAEELANGQGDVSQLAEPQLDGTSEPRPSTTPAAINAAPLDDFDTSLFPAPPVFYHRYSDANLALPLDAVIADVPGEPRPFSRRELEPPNVEWIVEDGSYSVFGETWPVEEKTPTLAEMGVPEMFDGAQDRKVSLQTLLRTLVLTYTQLLDALLAPPPSLAHPEPTLPDGRPAPTDPERLTEHMRLICFNMHYLVNELRPVQARQTLKAMLRSQIELRRRKTIAIKQKCAEMNATLASLQSDTLAAARAEPTRSRPLPASPADAAAKAADEALDIFARLRAKAAEA